MQKPNSSSPPACLGPIFAILMFLWIIFVSLNTQLLAWAGILFGEQVTSAIPTLAQVLLLGLPLLPLAWFWPRSYERAIFRAWLLATGYLLFLLPGRLFPSTQSQMILLAQFLLSLGYLGVVLLLTRSPQNPDRFQKPARVSLLPALGLAAPITYPWLAWGASGSLLDTLLGLALGLTAGVTAAIIIERTWLRSLSLILPLEESQPSIGRGWRIFIGGLVSGAAWLIVASGLSFNGVQLLLMLTLPGLGWAAMILSDPTPPKSHPWLPPALLIGLAAAAVLTLTDTDGLVIEAMDPAVGWAFLAAGLSFWLGWLLAGAAWLVDYLQSRWRFPWLPGGGVAALWLVGLTLYLATGRPGLYGDRLFVILKDQADVSAAARLENYDSRRRFIYDTLTAHANRTQADLRAGLDAARVEYKPYYLVNALEVRGGLLHRWWLSTRPEVDRVIPSPVMRPLPQEMSISKGEAAAPTEPQWNLTNIGADRVWAEFNVTGQGIVIGQSDSGVQYDHPELQAGYRGRQGAHDYNWWDPWLNTPAPVDYGGHGTHTLGSIVGKTVGVAPGAEWFACANLSRNLGNPALYLDCLQFMLAPYPQGGDPLKDGDPLRSAHVLNNSWGCPQEHEGCDPNSLLPAVRALRAAGIFVVASAGNDGPACSTIADPLAIYAEVVSVGAVDKLNQLSGFSSLGPVTVDGSGRTKPDLVAPGVDILSAFPDNSYAANSGTSMAGPHVVGVVALMWSANPKLIGNIERTEQILLETATPLENGSSTPTNSDCSGQAGRPNDLTGYGLVNAYEAVRRALAEQ